jgi:hypothetical protein
MSQGLAVKHLKRYKLAPGESKTIELKGKTTDRTLTG